MGRLTKPDVGSHRAGIEVETPKLLQLVERCQASTAVDIYGFYCHAGHAYAGRTPDEAEVILKVELQSAVDASALLPQVKGRSLVLSIGSTPTAHVVGTLKASLPAGVNLELHAGRLARSRKEST